MNENQNIPKIIIYLPVMHAGYINFLKQNPNNDVLIIDDSMIKLIDEKFDYLRKEIRAINPSDALLSLKAIFPDREISLLSVEEFMRMSNDDGVNGEAREGDLGYNNKFIMPKEDIFIWLAKEYLSPSRVEFSTTFLRWNRDNTDQKNDPQLSSTESVDEFSQKIMKLANLEKELSSDWWRQVAAILIKDEKIISIAHNQHLPSPYGPYISSDPRNSFHKGENIDLSTAIHAEAAIISSAAKDGIVTKSAQMYVSTFPCPTCAKLIAGSGISKLFFSEGYSVLDGDKILKDAGVEVIKIPPAI